ncbi:MAG: hypothetical protein A3G27_04970 [Betaproteobacteria bacterium RIFCSPLOWO2_12_FULL_66_14]|nr:MAG: hypothetical protein A3G27_04970 [Betaproteobacteria bacterium RIFCSPLOWO2_12_FULL_66_14]
METSCFHCGDPVPAGSSYAVRTERGWRSVCCAGCEAVAYSILGQGLEDFYRLRGAQRLERPAESCQENLELYDHPELQRAFVREVDDNRETVLLLEGIRCPACVWLNEQTIRRVPGVVSAHLNYSTRRAILRWDPRRARLSDVLQAVKRVGYRAHPYDAARDDKLQREERRDALWRLFVAGFGMMQVMMYALPAYVAGDGDMSADIGELLRWASFALTVPVVFYAAAPFFSGARRDLARGRLGMDVSVALGIAIAFGASVAAMLLGAAEVYFDSVTMFVFLLLGGRYLEMLARQRATSVLQHLSRLIPEGAHRLRDFPRSLEVDRIPACSLKPGEHTLVKPGESFPADGVVEQGSGEVNEALLTGEGRPVFKQPGNAVIGGSMNLSTPLVMRVEKVGGETVLSCIARLIERAAADRPRLVALAERWVTPFMLCVVLLAVAAALGWAAVDPARSLPVAVAVLVATCPCAFSLATPAALTVATGELARLGVIVTRAHAIEALGRVSDVVLDKTGTLTRGEPVLVDIACHSELPEEKCLALAAAMEAASEHPIGKAFAAAVAGRGLPAVSALDNVPGSGIEAVVEGHRYRLGSPAFAQALAPCVPVAPRRYSEVWLAAEGGLLASFQLADEIRPEAAEAVRRLQSLGLALHVLSGDGVEATGTLAARLDIGAFEGRADPERKRNYVAALQRQGKLIAMVGDGINDAPVLARADVSLAMGGGTRLAQIQADAVVLSQDLVALAEAIELSRRTLCVVRQNVAWAFAYNLSALPLALFGALTPWAAAIGMSVSSLLVVLNALRLQRSRRTSAAVLSADGMGGMTPRSQPVEARV